MKKEIQKPENKKDGQKNKGGRPLAITKEKEEELIKLMADGMTQNEACRYVGINKTTILQHKNRFPAFTARLEKAKEETTKFAYKSVKVGMVKDWRAGSWWLERTNPRFKEKIQIEEKPSLVLDVFEDEDDELKNE